MGPVVRRAVVRPRHHFAIVAVSASLFRCVGSGSPSSSSTSGVASPGDRTAPSAPASAGPQRVAPALMPLLANTEANGAVQFAYDARGAGTVWTVVEGASGGSVSTSGMYTAPAAPGTYHVTATATGQSPVTATVLVHGGGGRGGRGCSGLPTAWENVSPVTGTPGDSSGKNFSEAIVVDPFDPETVWLGTGFAGVFKSTNCGGTWARVNTGRNAGPMDNGSHASMAVDPVDRGTLYTVSLFGEWGVWKSTNGGVDWDQITPPGSEVARVTNRMFDCIAIDPGDHRHLVAGMHGTCEQPYAPTCQAETKDGGATWHLLKTPTPNWEEGAGPWILDGKSWLYGGAELWLTNDSGASWRKVTPAGAWGFAGGEVETHPIPHVDGTYYLTSSQGLVRSTDGRTWSRVAGLEKRVVGFATGKGQLFASDQWSSAYYTASNGHPGDWKTIPPPAALPQDQGAPFLDFDATHHVLYSSNYAAGTWRIVVP
jgi:hypothetical protein